MGIRDRPISPRSPWQNPYVERLIGTLRRDCLDHVLIFGEPHLRRVLALYSQYYNEARTHLGLGKDAPLGAAGLSSPTWSKMLFHVLLNTIGMGAGSGQFAAIDDQILIPNRTILKPAFEDLPGPSGVARLRR